MNPIYLTLKPYPSTLNPKLSVTLFSFMQLHFVSLAELRKNVISLTFYHSFSLPSSLILSVVHVSVMALFSLLLNTILFAVT